MNGYVSKALWKKKTNKKMSRKKHTRKQHVFSSVGNFIFFIVVGPCTRKPNAEVFKLVLLVCNSMLYIEIFTVLWIV